MLHLTATEAITTIETRQEAGSDGRAWWRRVGARDGRRRCQRVLSGGVAAVSEVVGYVLPSSLTAARRAGLHRPNKCEPFP